MLIGRERFEEVYNTIKQGACAGGACTVLILVAPDCDAVCACHILTRLLRDDNIPFKVTPVSGYGDVAAATSDASDEYSETRSVIMLNCGGTVNLEQVFGASAATVFVVDSHRPLHLRNVHSGGKVVVLDAEAMDADSGETSAGFSLTQKCIQNPVFVTFSLELQPDGAARDIHPGLVKQKTNKQVSKQ